MLSSFLGGELDFVTSVILRNQSTKVFTIFELGMSQASESFWMGTKENVWKVPEFILGAPLVLMSIGRKKWADHS